MQWTKDNVTVTSQLTSSEARDTYTIITDGAKHLTTVHGVLSNSSHDNVVVETASVLHTATQTASGDHVTTTDMTLSSTGSGLVEASRGGGSAHRMPSFAIYTVIGLCVCVLVSAAVSVIVVRYVAIRKLNL